MRSVCAGLLVQIVTFSYYSFTPVQGLDFCATLVFLTPWGVIYISFNISIITGPKEQKMPRLPKGFQSSTDAYMLVYTSESHKPNSNEVKLSDKLQDYVDTENKGFTDTCEEIISGKVFFNS